MSRTLTPSSTIRISCFNACLIRSEWAWIGEVSIDKEGMAGVNYRFPKLPPYVQTWPLTIPNYTSWYDKVLTEKADDWKHWGIYEMISFSLKEITTNWSLLFAFMRFWSTGINGFVFPFGMISPTFWDVQWMLAKMLVVLVVLFSSFNSGLPGMFLSSWLLLWNRLRLQKKAYLCHFLNYTSFVRKTIFEFIQDLLNTWSQSIFSFAPPLPNFLTKRWVIVRHPFR